MSFNEGDKSQFIIFFQLNIVYLYNFNISFLILNDFI